MNALLQAVIARLTAANLGYRSIAPLESLADLPTQAHAFPAAFVIPATENFTPEQEGGGVLIVRNEVEFDVVTIVLAAKTPGLRQSEMAALAGAVVTELLGFTPDSDVWRPMVPVASRLLGIEGGRASWITRFRSVCRLRKNGVL